MTTPTEYIDTPDLEDNSDIAHQRRAEIESLLNPAINATTNFNSKVQNIQSYLTRLLERNTLAMNACANSQFNSISKTIDEYTEFLNKLDFIILNDPNVKSLVESNDWYRDKVNKLQQKSVLYSEKADSFKNNCELILEKRKELEAKLKAVRLENMRLEFRLNKHKQRENSSLTLRDEVLKSFNNTQVLKSKCPSIFSSFTPSYETILHSGNLETAQKYNYEVSSLKQNIFTARRQIDKFQRYEGFHRKQPLALVDYFQQCFESVFKQLLTAQELEPTGNMDLFFLMKQESKSPKIRNKSDEIRLLARSHKDSSSRSDMNVSFDALERKVKNLSKEMKHYTLNSGSMAWEEFKSLRFEQFCLLLVLSPNVVEEISKAICNVKVNEGLKFKDKKSVTKSPWALKKEFCNSYVAKLKVRTNQQGEIATGL